MNNTIIDINTDFTSDEIVTIKKLIAYLKPFVDNNNQSLDEGATAAIDKLITMSKDSTLETLFEIITFIAALKNSMTTEIILKTTQLIPDPALISKLEQTIEAAKETKEELDRNTPRIGAWGLLSALKEPETQYLLNYLLVMSRKVTTIVKD